MLSFFSGVVLTCIRCVVKYSNTFFFYILIIKTISFIKKIIKNLLSDQPELFENIHDTQIEYGVS